MDQPTCKTCAFWDREDGEVTNRCRRLPPIRPPQEFINDIPLDPGAGFWPFTDDNDWCGEHQDMAAYLAKTETPR